MDAVDRTVGFLGIKDLKAEQRKVIDVFMCERDVFICLPTPFCKSVCYMVLSLLFDIIRNAISGESIVLVVSPLMADQVESCVKS